jgi:D-alanyl-D-alanine carboxypeptidase-like protein
VTVSKAGLPGTLKVRSVAIADLTELAAAAKAAGTPVAVQSAYRSYSQQKTTFDYWVSVDGYRGALKVSARPGHSEHQLGLAIDFKSDAGGPPWEGTDWALSPAGKWMKANAWKYGWVMSYPKGESATVCYSYEPWHYRYLGRELAAAIHASGLTIREYLWSHFTTAEVPPPAPSGQPAASASGLPSSSPELSPSPTPEPTLAPTPTPTLASAPTLMPTAPPASPTGDGTSSVTAIAAIAVAALAFLLIGAGWAGRGRRARRQ